MRLIASGIPLLGVAVAVVLYLAGSAELARRGTTRSRGLRRWRLTAFLAGAALLLVALSGPVDGLADRSVAVHMGQHLVLLVAAPPLLVLGRPLAPLLLALPPRWRRPAGRCARRIAPAGGVLAAVLVTEAHVLAMWLWHVPALFDAALASTPVHIAEHTSFLVTGLAFWWLVLEGRNHGVQARAVALAATIAASMQSAALGILMTLASTPWYAQGSQPAPWGLGRLADQQAAGAEMWVVAGGVYVVVAGMLVAGLARPGLPGLTRDATGRGGAAG